MARRSLSEIKNENKTLRDLLNKAQGRGEDRDPFITTGSGRRDVILPESARKSNKKILSEALKGKPGREILRSLREREARLKARKSAVKERDADRLLEIEDEEFANVLGETPTSQGLGGAFLGLLQQMGVLQQEPKSIHIPETGEQIPTNNPTQNIGRFKVERVK